MKFFLFDAYGTLVELDDFYGRLQRGFACAGQEMPLETVTKAAREEMHFYITHTVHARTEADWIALKQRCAGVLTAALGRAQSTFNLPPAQVLQVLEESLVFRAFPETREVLEALRERCVQKRCAGMGVLSNWDFSLHHVLDQTGLSRYFDFAIPSSQLGIQKPDKRFFAHALGLARQKYSALKSEECCYIGDHYDGDVEGARGAGMVPVWLVRQKRDMASGELREDKKVLRIRDLRGLMALT